MNSITFTAIGTTWKIDSESDLFTEEVVSKIRERISEFDIIYSRFLNNSFINRFAKKAGNYTLPADAKPLFDIYFELNKYTDGKFTPLIGKTLEELGYDRDYSLVPSLPSKVASLKDVLDYKFPKLKVKRPVQLDFGAAGKGYLVDIVGELLKAEGFSQFAINAGGDILHYSAKSKSKHTIKVGLEHPHDPQKVIGTIEISNSSICASSGTRRQWHNFHHIIDPFTLASPPAVLATWVIASNTILADALSTSLFFVDADILRKHYTFESVILFSDLSVLASENFSGELFYA